LLGVAQPDPATFLSWAAYRPGFDHVGSKTPLRIEITERRYIRIYWIDDPFFHGIFRGLTFHSRSHNRIRYECSAWKMTLLVSTTKKDGIILDKFEGDVESFNRDTLHAKLYGVFDS
jgi:hypothetical protein